MSFDRASFDRTVVVFDDRAAASALIADPNVAACAQLYVDRAIDGIYRISQFLVQRRTPIASLHLVAHGSADRLVLGKTPLDLTTLPRYAPAIARWPEWLAEDAEIVIYGCNVAAESSALLRALHELTGARIVASSTPVGASDRGGNWNLDVRIGKRDRRGDGEKCDEARSQPDPVLFASATRRRYRATLIDPTVFTDAPDGFVTTDAEVSLREAIDETEDGGTIELGEGVYLIEDAISPNAGDDDNKRGDFDIVGKSLTIRGLGEDRTSINAQALDRVFHILGGASLTLENLTIRNGQTTGENGAGILSAGSLKLQDTTVSDSTASGDARGAGVSIESGTFVLEDSTISGNTLSGGSNQGAGLYSQGASVTIEQSLIDGNEIAYSPSPTNRGGGIFTNGGSIAISDSIVSNNSAFGLFAKGGGISVTNGTSLSINDSTISGNTADAGGGIDSSTSSFAIQGSKISQNEASYIGGIYAQQSGTATISTSSVSENTGSGLLNRQGTLSVTSSAFVNNRSSYNGGGIFNAEAATLTLTNSTISGNTAANKGGGIINFGEVTLKHVTIANNSAPLYGGLYDAAPGGGDYRGEIKGLSNSIISGNSPQDFFSDPGNVTPIVTGVNIVADGSLTRTNVLNVDPLLGPLKQNGGGSPTHELLEESPAIGAADPFSATTTDQRNLARDRNPDLGAFELVDLFTILESAGSTKVLENFSGAGSSDDANSIGDFYFVGLNFQPDSDVTVTISFDNDRVILTEDTLTFTPDNWDVPQFVFVAAVNDNINSGGRASTIAHDGDSEDLRFFVEDIQDVNVSIFDDDGTAGEILTLTNALAYGGSNNDVYTGTDEVESIFGNAGLDLIFGRGGNDRLFGGDGDDGVSGGDGDDYVNGEAGNDFLSGGRGIDVMYGSDGNDILSGDDGDDILNGGDGNDELIGGAGNDILVGGLGNDIFTLDGLGVDTIADYQLNSDSLSLLTNDLLVDLSFSVSDSTTSIFDSQGRLLVRLDGVVISSLSNLQFLT